MTGPAITSAAPAAREPRSAERASGLRAHARRFVVCAGVVAGALHANAASAQAAPGASARRPPDTSLRIELRPAVEVERSGVTLGDVASLDGPASLTRRLAALPLGPAPRAGEIVRVEREDVARWVRARTGLDGARITWSGAAAVSVRRAMRAVAGATLARHAEDGLRSALERDRLRVELSANPVPRGVNVPAGRMEIQLRPVPRDAVLSKRLTVWMDVSVDGSFVRAIAVGFDVRVSGPALVATEGLQVGQLLATSSLVVHEVEWSGRSAVPVDSGSNVEGLRLRRPLAPGDAVTRAHVEAAPLVARGDWATLRATQGVVALESRVEVLQDGMSGQRVRVKLPNASSAIFARVTGRGTVEVRE